jgi:hypothetical protein
MSEILSFYNCEAPDHAGRYLVDIWAFADEKLEKTHDYIQWLFPNREVSSVNPKAPLLTDEVVEEFKSNSYLLKNVKISLDRMIKFYEMDEENPWWCTKNNHNYLRCTRILNTLREFGMIEELSEFYSKLMIIADNNEVIHGLTRSYWEDAFEGQKEYLIVVTVDVKVKASRSVDVRAASLEEAKNLASAEVEDCIGEYGLGSKQYEMDYKKIDITSIKAEEE